MTSETKPKRKMREGVVVSTKMQKTITVLVERTYQHPEFNKVITRSRKYYAHCPNDDVQVGQRVRITETRPLSKLKRWCLFSVVS